MGHCIITCRAITTIIIIIVITIDVAMFLPIISVDLTTKNSSPASFPSFFLLLYTAQIRYTPYTKSSSSSAPLFFLQLCCLVLFCCLLMDSVHYYRSRRSRRSLSLVIVFICVLRSFAHHLVYGPSRVTPYVMLFFAPQSQPDSSASHR